MRVGVVVQSNDWKFFTPVFSALSQRHRVSVFQEREIKTPVLYYRLNNWVRKLQLARFMQANDVVFFEWASKLLSEATELPQWCPILTRLHLYELIDWAPRVNWAKVNRVILVSKAMQRQFLERYPHMAQRTLVINNGVSLTTFIPKSRSFSGKLGTLGALIPRKGAYELILTLAELRQRGYGLSLHIAGGDLPGSEYQQYYLSMRSAVAKLGLHAVVQFYGHVENPHEWLSGIDVFISNSFREGQQMALLEAMATGCYCLAHFWDGVEEILPEEYIFATPADLVQKVIEYCELPDEEKVERQRRMRSIAEAKFDEQRMVREILDVIEQTARG
ncbi:MAG: glycosyltransferase family 4 protein [Candidatus Methanomethyliaceae archaeon]